MLYLIESKVNQLITKYQLENRLYHSDKKKKKPTWIDRDLRSIDL